MMLPGRSNALHGRLGWSPGIMALIAVAANAVSAQTSPMTVVANISVAPIVTVQQANAPAVVSRDTGVIVMSVDLIFSGNSGFDVAMRPASGMDALRQHGITMSVLTAAGSYTRVDGTSPVTVARVPRGAGHRAHVVYRFESAAAISDADVAVAVVYSAVAMRPSDGSGALPSVLATQQLNPAVQVGQSGQ